MEIPTYAIALAAVFALLFSGAIAKEAYRSRIDTTAQRVVVASMFVEQNVMTKPSGVPQPVQQATHWDMPLYDAQSLTINANMTIRNEGTVTVFLKIDDPSVERSFNTLTNNNPALGGGPLPSVQDGWALVPPSFTAHLRVSWTRTSKDWWHDFKSTSGDICPTRVFTLMMRDATDSALDVCSCEFGYLFMGSDPVNGSCVILPPLPVNQVRLSIAKVGKITRTYPQESRWYRVIPFKSKNQ